MENRVWDKVEDKQGTVLALTGDALYRLEFSGKDAKREATDVATALLGGGDPATVVSSSSKKIPLTSIQRVEVSHDHDTVKFFTLEGDKPVKVEFSVRSGDDGPGIARAVVERAGITHPERSEDISVGEALIAPVILGVIAGVLWGFTYFMAIGLDRGEDFDVNRGSGRGRLFKRIILFVAETLGTNGTIALGVILLIAFVGWAIHLIVKRPQRLVWGPPAAA